MKITKFLENVLANADVNGAEHMDMKITVWLEQAEALGVGEMPWSSHYELTVGIDEDENVDGIMHLTAISTVPKYVTLNKMQETIEWIAKNHPEVQTENKGEQPDGSGCIALTITLDLTADAKKLELKDVPDISWGRLYAVFEPFEDDLWKITKKFSCDPNADEEEE